MEATAQTIRGGYDLKKTQCRVMSGKQPPARSGEFFISIHPAAIRIGDDVGDDDIEYGMAFTITQRTGFVPYDQEHEGTVQKQRGILYWCNELTSFVKANRFAIIRLANTLMGMEPCGGQGFMVAGKMKGGVYPVRDVPEGWFGERPKKGQASDKKYGKTTTIVSEGWRWLQSGPIGQPVTGGIGVMIIEDDFIVAPNDGVSPDPVPDPVQWNEFVDNRRFSFTSGGNAGFSSSGNWIALRDWDWNWELRKHDGTVVPITQNPDTPFVRTDGQRNSNWIWAADSDKFWWVSGAFLECWEVSSTGRLSKQLEHPLPTTVAGRPMIFFQSANNYGPTHWLSGYSQVGTDQRDYVWPFASDGTDFAQPGFWIRDIGGALGATQMHNGFPRGGEGFALSFQHPTEQTQEYITSWGGDYLQKVMPGRTEDRLSHSAWYGTRMVGYFSDVNGLEVWDYANRQTPVKIADITQAQMREALGTPDTYVGYNHAHYGPQGIALVLREDVDVLGNIWHYCYWDETNGLRRIAGPFTRLEPSQGETAFHHTITPTQSLDGRFGALHASRGVQILTIPGVWK